MQLDHLTREQVLELNLATGVPVVYEFDSQMRITSKRVLGD
jgi:2,3-bisphosphoglycerate-dependent phosphoglycerate mutase